MEGSYPKYVFNREGKDRLVQSAEAHEALEAAEPETWAESPAHFDASGRPIRVPDADPAESPAPGAPGGGPKVEYPKWLYHRDGKRAQVIESKAAHDALVDRGDWFEDQALTEAQRANSIANQEPSGQALYETPVRDVVEMLQRASLETLERTYALEEKNPGGPRKTLLRELGEMIEEAQKAADAAPE